MFLDCASCCVMRDARLAAGSCVFPSCKMRHPGPPPPEPRRSPAPGSGVFMRADARCCLFSVRVRLSQKKGLRLCRSFRKPKDLAG